MSFIKLIVIKGSVNYDMSELVKSITWSGRKGAAARSITINLLDDDGYGHDRSGIDCEKGDQCIFYWKKDELFRGIIVNHNQTDKKIMTVKAYDNGIYLSNNKDSFNYTNKTASWIFKDCMTRFDLKVGTVANSKYIIPELPKPKTSPFDVICDALSLTYKATGTRFYPLSMKGNIFLLERKENTLQWVIETGVNLLTYTYTKSIENTKTRIRLLTKEGTVLAEKVNSSLEKKIGKFMDVDTPDDSLNAAQLDEMVKSMLQESGYPDKSLELTALGIPQAYAGMCVYVIIKSLNIARTFYIDEDSHTFKGRHHAMNLKLNFANDINAA